MRGGTEETALFDIVKMERRERRIGNVVRERNRVGGNALGPRPRARLAASLGVGWALRVHSSLIRTDRAGAMPTCSIRVGKIADSWAKSLSLGRRFCPPYAFGRDARTACAARRCEGSSRTRKRPVS
jgi:hypothetical protein